MEDTHLIVLPLPCHRYLVDGRLLCWYWHETTGEVEGFRIVRDAMAVDEGLRLLEVDGCGTDGVPVNDEPDRRLRRVRGNRWRRY